MLLTLTTWANYIDNLFYLQWQLVLLTMTTCATDNLSYWQWQLVPMTACYRAHTCHDNLDSFKVHNTTICEVPLKPKNIELQICSVYENKSLIDVRKFQRPTFPISFFFSANWMQEILSSGVDLYLPPFFWHNSYKVLQVCLLLLPWIKYKPQYMAK